MGKCHRRYTTFCRLLLTLKKDGSREMRRRWKRFSSKRELSDILGRTLVISTQHECTRLEEELVDHRDAYIHWYIKRKNFTCRSTRPKGELIERTHNDVIASRSTREKIKNVKVMEDFESRSRKAVTFLVERVQDIQEVREWKLLIVLSDFSGGENVR